MLNWSPEEALPAILQLGRTPLTISEGISWLLQQPQLLERNHCFMTIASRKTTGARKTGVRKTVGRKKAAPAARKHGEQR